MGTGSGTIACMTYNIRLNTTQDGDNAWPLRRKRVADQIVFHHPHVLGVQEARPEQVDWLDSALEDYAYVGEGREGGRQGEHSALFYDRHQLRVVRSGTFWLSPTPQRVSMGWDAAYPRICTWAELQYQTGGPSFMVFNTHFDHVGEEARAQSAGLILRHMDSLNVAGLPAVLMGDLNLTPESAAVRTLTDTLTDAHLAAPRRMGPERTFTGFHGDAEGDRRIDYLMLSPGLKVVRYGILTDWSDGSYASDHLPVFAEIELRSAPLVIAHRGASGYAPENTLAAFQKAVDLGADMIELDVFTLADGEVVCFHDAGLQRLTGQSGNLADLTLAEVRQLSVDGVHRIPTLREVLELTDKRLRINIELKGPDTAEPTYAILREYRANHGWKMSDFHISSFRHDELRTMRRLDSTIAIGILPHGNPLGALDVARELKAISINANQKALNPDSVAKIHAEGLRIYAWTVNDYQDIRRLLDLGIDGFITNYPDRVQRLSRE